MATARTDRRLILVTGALVAVAGILFAGVVFLATGRDSASGTEKPLFLGLRPELTAKIREGGPLYFANPFAGDGFWLDLEDDQIVALALDRPGTKGCVIKWKAQRNAYVDCDNRSLTSRDLDRFQIDIGRRDGSPRRSVFVDLRTRTPAPGPGAGG